MTGDDETRYDDQYREQAGSAEHTPYTQLTEDHEAPGTLASPTRTRL